MPATSCSRSGWESCPRTHWERPFKYTISSISMHVCLHRKGNRMKLARPSDCPRHPSAGLEGGLEPNCPHARGRPWQVSKTSLLVFIKGSTCRTGLRTTCWMVHSPPTPPLRVSIEPLEHQPRVVAEGKYWGDMMELCLGQTEVEVTPL